MQVLKNSYVEIEYLCRSEKYLYRSEKYLRQRPIGLCMRYFFSIENFELVGENRKRINLFFD